MVGFIVHSLTDFYSSGKYRLKPISCADYEQKLVRLECSSLDLEMGPSLVNFESLGMHWVI